MKQFYNLLVLCLMAIGANAQTKIAGVDFTTATKFTDWYQFAEEQTKGKIELLAGEGLAITVDVQTGQLWQPQIMAISDFNLEKDRSYKVVITAKFPTAGTLQIKMGNWVDNDQAKFTIGASNDYQTIECNFENWSVTAVGAHLLFQCGDFKGTTFVKSIEVYDMSREGDEGGEIVLYENDFTDIAEFTGWRQFADEQTDGKVELLAGEGLAITVDVQTGQLWQPQIMVIPDGSFNLEKDRNYKVVITAKFPTAGTLQINMGNWVDNDQAKFTIGASNDYQTIECNFENWSVTAADAHLLFQCGGFKGTIILKKVEVIDLDGFNAGGIYYRIGKDNTVSVISGMVKSLGNVVIPNQETYNGKIYSVTSIGTGAFSDCSGLTSITIPNSVTYIGEDAFSNCNNLTAVHISDLEAWLKVNIAEGNLSLGGNASVDCSSSPLYYAHHLYLNGKEVRHLEIPNTITKINNHCCDGWSGLLSVTIPNSVTSIGYEAFLDCSGLNSVTIPNSVKSIEGWAFGNCRSLTSLSLGSGLDRIDYCSFMGCSSLISIVSEIMNPFEFSENVFDNDIYTTAILTVPAGTKSLYQSTAGWNKFKNIVEDNSDEANFSFNGITYQGTKSSKTVVVKAVDKSLTIVEIPASVGNEGTTYQVTGIADDAFKGNNMAALVWNVEAALPNNAFNNASIGSNFLLYVKQASFAPSSIKNVIANGTASSIVLSDDGGPFYCPQTFTARSISYIHNYSMETGGNGKGWETIALPFDVQRIVHSTRGEIVPFAGYSSASNQKPFWLGNMSASGFKRASSIQANEPYLIAMPNNSKYNNDYNLAGDVTFSADNVQVAKTPTFSGLFLPAFGTVPQSSTVYALNVNNRHVKYSGNYDAGSRFIANLRDIRPFEAYISNSSTRGIIKISFDDGATDMLDILLSTDESQKVSIHTLSGQQIICTAQRDFDAVWRQLPKGVYIINGKKWIK